MKDNKQSILIISALFPPEPLVTSYLVYDLADDMSKENMITVLSPRPSRPAGSNYSKSQSVEYPFVHETIQSFICPLPNPIGRLIESISFGLACTQYIRKAKAQFDVIYQNSWPLFSQYFICKTAKRKSIPIVTHIEDIYPESMVKRMPQVLGEFIMKVFLPIDKSILKNSTMVIAISQRMKQYLVESRNIKQDKIKIIYNWQNDSAFIKYQQKPLEATNKRFTFMYVGSINSSACVGILIKGFIEASIENSRFIIVGQGSDKTKCIALAKKLKADNIEFFDIDRDKVPNVQAFADVLVLALRKGVALTATPSKFTAYALSGKPVLAAVDEDSDIADLIKGFKCGRVVEPENIDLISKEMRKIANLGRSELGVLGSNAYNLAETVLSRDCNRNKLEKLISSCVEE